MSGHSAESGQTYVTAGLVKRHIHVYGEEHIDREKANWKSLDTKISEKYQKAKSEVSRWAAVGLPRSVPTHITTNSGRTAVLPSYGRMKKACSFIDVITAQLQLSQRKPDVALRILNT